MRIYSPAPQADSNSYVLGLPEATRIANAEAARILNRNARGLYIWWHIRDLSGGAEMYLEIESIDIFSGKRYTIITTQTQGTPGLKTIAIYPETLEVGASERYRGIIPRDFGITVKQSPGKETVYSLAYALMV